MACGLALSAMAGRALGQQVQQHYAGFIDGKIAVSMELTTDDAGKATGKYQYAISGKDLFLAGDVVGDSAITLVESTDQLQTTGKFRLLRDPNDGSLTGTWTSADGTRVLAAKLAKIATTQGLIARKPADYSASTGYLVFPERSDFLKALNSRLKVESATVQAALLNDALADAKDRPKSGAQYQWEGLVEPAVTYADASLVSIKTMHYVFSGGAHGNTGYSAGNYAWRDGALASLNTSDLLDPKPASLQAVTRFCIKSLKAQKASSADGLVIDRAHPPTLNVTRAGLLFTFDPYAVGSYAEGTYTVVIPWKEAGDFIPAASPIRRLMDPGQGAAALPGPTPPAGGADFPRPD
jgi:hypothetical protein